ncbi:MAG: cobalamin-binding protein [Dehalococcoidia bacterium]|nr:cobalamin-binding protein [Dehalococcoidia bacterium]
MTAFTDALGRPVHLPGPPRRIVSLVPSITEMLFAFGLGDAIAGVTKFCVEPRDGVAAKPRVGGTKTADVARILALAPDLVIANAEENSRDDIDRIAAAGIAVFVTYPRSVRAAIDMMRVLAAITGAGPEADSIIAECDQELARARKRLSAAGSVSVFCPIWREPWMTIGPDTYMHDFLWVCGGANVFGHRPERYPQISLDEAAAQRPEAVLLPDEPYHFRRRHAQELQAYPEVPAVRDGRIYLVDGKQLCWYGPRIAGGLRSLQELLHGPKET